MMLTLATEMAKISINGGRFFGISHVKFWSISPRTPRSEEVQGQRTSAVLQYLRTFFLEHRKQ